jgi:hypothetical protein
VSFKTSFVKLTIFFYLIYYELGTGLFVHKRIMSPVKRVELVIGCHTSYCDIHTHC